ncbi:hypothetical protein T06_1569 [Trichinella sp. T6]|nr:hypothetical protein T06_1569 [Trichinella sp. T6]
MDHVKNAKQSNEDDNKCPPDLHFADKLEIKTLSTVQSQYTCQDLLPPYVDRSESTARRACSAKKSKKLCEAGSSASFPHVDLSIGIVCPLAAGTPVVVVPSGNRIQRCRDSFQLPSILIGGHSTCYALPIVLPFPCRPRS